VGCTLTFMIRLIYYNSFKTTCFGVNTILAN
jgi:hypothetical protein